MLTPSQQRIVGMALSARSTEPADTVVATLPLSRRRMAFLIDAIDAFYRDSCPQHGGTGGCQLLEWQESPATGAIETACGETCLAWRDELIASIVSATPVSTVLAPPAVLAPPIERDRFVPAD
jgi:hypothetical protein